MIFKILFSKTGSLIKNISPDLSLWINLPAFTGWCALSCGIAAGHRFASPAAVPSILYNKTGLVTMVMLGGLIFVCSSKLLRTVCFFALGLCLYTYGLADQRQEFNQWRTTLSAHKKCLLSGHIVSAPCLLNGKYSFILNSDSLYSFHGPGVLKNKSIACFSYTEPPSYGSIVLSGRFTPPQPAQNPGASTRIFIICQTICGALFTGIPLFRGGRAALFCQRPRASRVQRSKRRS